VSSVFIALDLFSGKKDKPFVALDLRYKQQDFRKLGGLELPLGYAMNNT
jgi:hypothetical protein